jgi:hypothetical protein
MTDDQNQVFQSLHLSIENMFQTGIYYHGGKRNILGKKMESANSALLTIYDGRWCYYFEHEENN